MRDGVCQFLVAAPQNSRAPLIRGVPVQFLTGDVASLQSTTTSPVFQHHRPASLLLENPAATHHIRHDSLRRAGGIIAKMAMVYPPRQRHVAAIAQPLGAIRRSNVANRRSHEDGRWPIIFREYVCAERIVGSSASSPNYANNLSYSRMPLRLIGEAVNPLRTIVKRTRVLLRPVMHNVLQGVCALPESRHTRQNAFSVGFNADWPCACACVTE